MSIIGHKGIQVLSNINSVDDLPEAADVESEAVWYIESGDFAPDYIAPSFWDGQQFNEWISLVDGEVLDGIPDGALYWNGDLEDDWETTVEDAGATAEKRDESLFVAVGNADEVEQVVFATINLVDLTDVSSIRFLSTGFIETDAAYRIGVEDEDPNQSLAFWDTTDEPEGGSETSSNWSEKDHVLDVSGLSGDYYVGFQAIDLTTSSDENAEVEVFEVELTD